jgi:hypothetical protein
MSLMPEAAAATDPEAIDARPAIHIVAPVRQLVALIHDPEQMYPAAVIEVPAQTHDVA